MQIKMSNVLDLATLYTKIKTKNFPIKTLYKFSKLFKVINEEKEFYSTNLQSIIDTYAQRDEEGNYVQVDNGNAIKIQEDKIGEAQAKINELVELPVDLPDITFTIDELESADFTVEEFNFFLPFITE